MQKIGAEIDLYALYACLQYSECIAGMMSVDFGLEKNIDNVMILICCKAQVLPWFFYFALSIVVNGLAMPATLQVSSFRSTV